MLAALVAGAFLLLPSAVPGDLVLPHVDVDRVFGAARVARAARYERFLYVDWVLAQIALFAVLIVYARRGAAYARESAAGPIGTGMLLGMLGLAFVWLVGVPFRLAGHWWDRRYGLTHLDYLSWVFQDWTILAAEFLSICFALLVVMGLARWLGERWWLPGAAVFVGIGALFTFVSPYLDYTTKPLEDPQLVAAAKRFESEQGVGHVPIRVEDVSDDTDQANAFAWGLGPSRQVVVWDTILQPPFTTREQEVVIAHEIGHHSSEHLPKGIAWFAIFAIPGAWILMRATRGRGGMGAGGGGSPRARRRRRASARSRAGAELDLAADGGRGRLEGAPVDARPGRAPEPHGRVHEDVPDRPEPARMDGRHARNAPDARGARRHGEGLGCPQRALKRVGRLGGVGRRGSGTNAKVPEPRSPTPPIHTSPHERRTQRSPVSDRSEAAGDLLSGTLQFVPGGKSPAASQNDSATSACTRAPTRPREASGARPWR